MDTRYAPPTAAVADVGVPSAAPQSVRRACKLIIASTLLGLANIVFVPDEVLRLTRSEPVLAGMLVGAAIMIGVTALLVVKIYRGRNWARWTMLLFAALNSVLTAFHFPELVIQSPVEAALALGICALDMAASWLLFFSDRARQHFANRRAV